MNVVLHLINIIGHTFSCFLMHLRNAQVLLLNEHVIVPVLKSYVSRAATPRTHVFGHFRE